MNRMFENNLSLSSLPDLSKQNRYEYEDKEELLESYSLLFHLLNLSEINNNYDSIISQDDI